VPSVASPSAVGASDFFFFLASLLGVRLAFFFGVLSDSGSAVVGSLAFSSLDAAFTIESSRFFFNVGDGVGGTTELEGDGAVSSDDSSPSSSVVMKLARPAGCGLDGVFAADDSLAPDDVRLGTATVASAVVGDAALAPKNADLGLGAGDAALLGVFAGLFGEAVSVAGTALAGLDGAAFAESAAALGDDGVSGSGTAVGAASTAAGATATAPDR
jgi:hypothetical protein